MSGLPQLNIESVDFNVLPMRTRFPFKYGIAAMTEVPHLLATVRVQVDGRPATGLASEGLPPKWFTKNPDTTFEEDLPDMLEVIRHAADLLREATGSFFDIWRQIYEGQAAWARERNIPPLLANLGVSLMERTVLDALCRHGTLSFGEVLRTNLLGIDLAAVHPELKGYAPADLLPVQSEQSMIARHTVGLGDPLTADDIDEPLNDGLPYALEACIEAYGLRYFKVKLCGQLDQDLARLQQLHAVLTRCAPPDYRITLDGNEQFQDIAAFAEHWSACREHQAVRELCDHLLFVEQPLHRDHALDDAVGTALANWEDAPPLIIDESEAELASLPRALDLGYRGTSHKNCKGIVKGIVNACLLEVQRRETKTDRYLSGEDLANVGPVALLQDLAVMAALGITHVERNGHHYLRGLSMYLEDIQHDVLAHHSDLYRRHPDGYPTLDIREGRLELGSVVEAPFGCGPLIDGRRFEALG